ncbi:MAG: endoribonuclease protein [Gemmatimonadetes bacterium]|nr:endoribonuclease protein [Gemmatimonadota bacterium]
MSAESRLKELGLVLPEPFRSPTGRPYPFRWVRVRGNRAYVSGHLPMEPEGGIASALVGKVGAEVSAQQGAEAARMVALAMLGSLRRELGSLDRVTAWLRVLGMVNVAPGFRDLPQVVNGFSELILDVFGPEVGAHSRSAVGMAELPFGLPVEVEAEVEIAP